MQVGDTDTKFYLVMCHVMHYNHRLYENEAFYFSFIFRKRFILVRVTADLEIIPGALG